MQVFTTSDKHRLRRGAGSAGRLAWEVGAGLGAAVAVLMLYLLLIHLRDRGGLVAHWSADGNANDSAGRNHGTLMNGASFAPGIAGQAFSFNGVNQFVQIPDSPAFDFANNDFSIVLWVRFTSLGGDRIFLAHDEGPYTVNKWVFWLNGNLLRLHLNGPAIGTVHLGSGLLAPVPGRWYHLAVTRSGSVITFYVDGVVNSTDSYSGIVPKAVAPLTIGQGENMYYFGGQEDEIGIYSRALSQAEISAMHKQDRPAQQNR